MLITAVMSKLRVDSVAVVKGKMPTMAITRDKVNRHSPGLKAVEEETATEMTANQEGPATMSLEETKKCKPDKN